MTSRAVLKLAAIVGCAGMVLALSAPQSLADTTTTFTLTGGSLTLTPPATIAWASLDVAAGLQTEDVSGTLSPSDLTGSGDGWNVTAAVSTALTDGTNTIPADDISFNGGATADSTTAPTDSVDAGGTEPSYPVTLSGSATPIFEAAAGYGEGANTISDANWWLTVPANTLAGSYTGALTIAVVSGP